MVKGKRSYCYTTHAYIKTAARLAQLIEHQSVVREVVVRFLAGPTLRVLK
jgi:hypothetical protein